jgi:undecaprenyl-diphosphatase
MEFWVLGTLLILAAGLWVFARLASGILAGRSWAFDDWALRSLRRIDDPRIPIGPEWLAEFARDLSALGSIAVLLLVTLISCGYLLLAGKVRLMAVLLAAVLTGQVMSSLLKYVVGRERPDVVPHLTTVSTASFPSGHAMLSAVVYLTLGALLARALPRRRERSFILGSAVVLSLTTGVTRVFLGVHHPTDVIAGWAIGTAWALCWWLALKGLQRHGDVEQPLPPRAPSPPPRTPPPARA